MLDLNLLSGEEQSAAADEADSSNQKKKGGGDHIVDTSSCSGEGSNLLLRTLRIVEKLYKQNKSKNCGHYFPQYLLHF